MGRWIMTCAVLVVGALSAEAFTIGETSAALGTQNTLAGTATPRASSTLKGVRAKLKGQGQRRSAGRSATGRWASGGKFGGTRGGTGAWVKGSARRQTTRVSGWATARSSGGWARGAASPQQQARR